MSVSISPRPHLICHHCMCSDKFICMLSFVLNIPYLPASYHWPAVTDSSTLLWAMDVDPRSTRYYDDAHLMTGVQLTRGDPPYDRCATYSRWPTLWQVCSYSRWPTLWQVCSLLEVTHLMTGVQLTRGDPPTMPNLIKNQKKKHEKGGKNSLNSNSCCSNSINNNNNNNNNNSHIWHCTHTCEVLMYKYTAFNVGEKHYMYHKS